MFLIHRHAAQILFCMGRQPFPAVAAHDIRVGRIDQTERCVLLTEQRITDVGQHGLAQQNDEITGGLAGGLIDNTAAIRQYGLILAEPARIICAAAPAGNAAVCEKCVAAESTVHRIPIDQRRLLAASDIQTVFSDQIKRQNILRNRYELKLLVQHGCNRHCLRRSKWIICQHQRAYLPVLTDLVCELLHAHRIFLDLFNRILQILRVLPLEIVPQHTLLGDEIVRAEYQAHQNRSQHKKQKQLLLHSRLCVLDSHMPTSFTLSLYYSIGFP